MAISYPKLPGTPPSRRPVVDEDPPVSIDTVQLERNTLAALQDGTLQKWELRERLHVDEQIISGSCRS